ncbi:MAG: energy-coupling factor transporter ATPase [Clostridiales bacterium]|nr:energy-coupling factor transporter ATPase [Clostridiales bacterium]
MKHKLPFTVRGVTVPGKRLGTELGFPTANLEYPRGKEMPESGVYVALAEIAHRRYTAILNQGEHPTAPGGNPTIEAHLLDYPGGDLYGKSLTLTYLHFLRKEEKFPAIEALKAQIRKDRDAARAWMAQSGNERIQPEPVVLETASYRYDEEGRQAVDDVSMAIRAGEFVAVLGHNGSGKSTLAKLMNALFLPTSGRVVVCGMDTKKEPQVWNIRKHAGMVFQNPDNQIVATVVREDVAFGLENIGMPRAQMIDRIDDALDAVSMKDYAAAAPHMLSGGQKQRVAVAGVLAMQPDVMVMDEATAMLDPTGRNDIFETTRRLNREKHITVVWITHFMEEAARADRVIVLSDGKVAMNGTPQKVFSQVKKLRKLGLDVPPMAMLSEMLNKRGLKLPGGILTVEDMVKELKVCLSR